MADSARAKKSIWLKFFREAGIPTGYDTKYALLFDENRIKFDMLMDLNKECLKDMGINAMGDIIAILKHAKRVYEETKEQAYDIPVPSSTTAKPVKLKSASPSSDASTSSSTGSDDPQSVIINTNAKPLKPVVSRVITPKSTTVKVNKNPVISSTVSSATQKNVSRERIVTPVKSSSKTISLKRSVSPVQKEEVPFQKKIRVPPEQEGGYIVKMPDGSIRKTQLKDRLGPDLTQKSSSGRSSVFNRLGADTSANVTSSSDGNGSLRQSSNSSAAASVNLSGSKSTSSVFQRLGSVSTNSSLSTKSFSNSPDFMKTTFEIKQEVPSGKVPRKYESPTLSRHSAPIVSSSTTSGLRSLTEGKQKCSIKSRLGRVGDGTENPDTHSASSIRTLSSRISEPTSTLPRRPGNVGVTKKTVTSSVVRRIEKTGIIGNKNTGVSSRVINEERFTNAEGKQMIRRTVLKKITKRP